MTVDNTVLALTRRQPESTRPIGRYLAGAISAARIAEGRRKAEEWKATLDAVEKRFGVDRWIILAIWAMETHYGALQPRFDVIRSLTTLAYARFRDDFFREELIAALLMLQQGHVPRQAMLGSWAGAMGQPQFMPSSFLKYAVSHSRKGSANIWTDVPDVFASIANFLCENGWQRDRAWGFEIVVPAGFDYRRSRAPLDEWARAGIRRADEAVLSGPDEHILFFPAGSRGPAFLVADNYSAIKRYNISDHYSLSVAHLADRMRGLGAIKARWPDDLPLPRDQRISLQRHLARLGYQVSNLQGYIDFPLRGAIREVQVRFNMVPDGNPTPALMNALRTLGAD